MLRQQFYYGLEDNTRMIVQFTTGSTAHVFNFTERKPYNIANLMNID